ncbi:hypothetical protein C4D60_Mb09t15720 [Musa balbisiana]|uniref:Uncharacterized protein n=1 Tax=Musa balbisiana TaxID=52838 RepID=A0A4V4H3A3_MUSBA|nr:hypothetical protein C4D60_Mb09t15720 [Musa balbisiana]
MAKRPVRYAVIDAFTGSPFKGNPAAVCLMDSSSPEVEVGDEWMQSVASEFNISVTCFVSRAISAVGAGSDGPSNGASPPRFSLRWFTPVAEVKLCGHGTLAAAHFLWTAGLVSSTVIEFVTKSGILIAKKVIRSNLLGAPNVAQNEAGEKFSIELDFPVIPLGGCNAAEMPSITETLDGALIVNIQKTDTSHDLIVELSSGKEVVDLHPNFDEIQKCAGRGLIVNAPAPPGSECDIFTRFFCPKFGVNEDPVCGSAHCALAPYWSKKLGKTNLIAYMLYFVVPTRPHLGYFLGGQAVDFAAADSSTFRLARFDSHFKVPASTTTPFLAPMAKRPVRYAVIDAFTGSPFKGNPAAVCLLDSSSPEVEVGDEWMQSVASEFNISETCFLSRAISAVGAGSDGPSNGASPPRFSLRWFTPVAEVKLCGHATLAAAHFLWTSGLVSSTVIEFVTESGILTAKKVIRSNLLGAPNVALNEAGEKFSIELDFPVIPVGGCNAAEMPSITETLNGASIVELSSGKEVVDLHPNFDEIQKCAGRGLIVTAPSPPGSEYDIFTRFFCPKFGINEDPVCGSAHCALAPYWSKKLGKTNLIAYMASPRGGRLDLQLVVETQRVCIQGEAVTVMLKNDILNF